MVQPKRPVVCVLGQLGTRVGEHLLRRSHFHQFSHVEIGGPLGYPCRLLHVVGDDGDGVFCFSSRSVPRFAGGDGVQGRTGFIHQDDFGIDRQGPGDAQALLLAAGKAQCPAAPAGLDLFPQAGLGKAVFDDFVEFGLLFARPWIRGP